SPAAGQFGGISSFVLSRTDFGEIGPPWSPTFVGWTQRTVRSAERSTTMVADRSAGRCSPRAANRLQPANPLASHLSFCLALISEKSGHHGRRLSSVGRSTPFDRRSDRPPWSPTAPPVGAPRLKA